MFKDMRKGFYEFWSEIFDGASWRGFGYFAGGISLVVTSIGTIIVALLVLRSILWDG
jgi:hypothetical protein